MRQQATSTCEKAGVSGRHDLLATFLEDLMVPAADTARNWGNTAMPVATLSAEDNANRNTGRYLAGFSRC